MITIEAAKELVNQNINEGSKSERHEWVIMEGETLKLPSGWVFFYGHREFIEKGDERFMAGGNNPIFIDMYDGSLHIIGSSQSVEEFAQEYEEKKKARDVQ